MALVACASPPLTPTPTPTPLSAEETLQRAVGRLATQAGFHFVLSLQGAPAYLDPTQTLAFGRAEGDYVAPDRARAVVRLVTPGLLTDVNVIAIGPTQWQTSVLTGRWQELPPDWGFNPTALFDPQAGLPVILMQDTGDYGITLEPLPAVEDAPAGDTPFYRVTGTLRGERVQALSGGLMTAPSMTFTLWIEPKAGDVQRLEVTEPPAEGAAEGRVWRMELSRWGQTVTIEPPLTPTPDE